MTDHKSDSICLYSKCTRKAAPQPEGHGFRFCNNHMHHWKTVRDKPSGRTYMITAKDLT